jgi:hypothetical protein
MKQTLTRDGKRYLKPRICARAGMFVVDRIDICAGKFLHGCRLPVGESPNERLAADEKLLGWGQSDRDRQCPFLALFLQALRGLKV